MAALFVAIGVLPFVGLLWLKVSSKRPSNLGVTDGRLAPCADSPNCVSSQDDRSSHQIEPFYFDGSPNEAWASLRAVLQDTPKATIVEDTGSYMSVECSTRVFRFTDDLEFQLDPTESRIHVRSASRVGYSDLGVNRQRLEIIRSVFSHESSAARREGQLPNSP